MKHVGKELLTITLEEPLITIFNSNDISDYNSEKIKDKTLLNLYLQVTKIWTNIENNAEFVPNNLRIIFENLQKMVQEKWPEISILKYIVPSQFIFLRFFSAAILSPQLFNIISATPRNEVSKNLISISKVLMNLANLNVFNDSHQLSPMNKFLEENFEKVKDYIDGISIHNPRTLTNRIQYAEQMSLLVYLLHSKMEKFIEKEEQFPIVGKLKEVLNELENKYKE